MLKFSLLLACVFMFCCAYALADQVSLKNGDRLSGTIVKSDGKTLLLHTDYAGDVILKWDAIQAIQSSEQLHFELQDGKTAVGSVATSDDKLEITSTTGATVEAPKSNLKTLRNYAEQAAYEKTRHAGLLQDWKAGLNVGFALTGGNSQTENLSLAFTGIRQTLHDKLCTTNLGFTPIRFMPTTTLPGLSRQPPPTPSAAASATITTSPRECSALSAPISFPMLCKP